MLTNELLQELKAYIERHFQEKLSEVSARVMFSAPAPMQRAACEYSEFDRFVAGNKKPPFNKVLLEMIDQKGMTDADVYKKAGIDRRLFSKIRSNADYRPGKNTIIALVLALELDRKKADQLLGAAGYALSDSETYDLVIQFCLNKKIYNVHDVNMALDYFSLEPLTGAE